MDTSQSIGQRIKLVRGELSQKAFGDRIGISQTTVTALENDQSKPRLNTLSKIAEGFHVNFEWLRTGSGSMRGSVTKPAEPDTAIPQPAAMLASPNVEDMTPEQQATFYRLRSERAERKLQEAQRRLAQYEEAQDQQQAVQLVAQAGGQAGFNDASADAADTTDEPPLMVAETNQEYAERAAEAQRNLIGFVYGQGR
jgi:transcriptional regulator with XRE-family HTH domain